jgi:hypothetical protein
MLELELPLDGQPQDAADVSSDLADAIVWTAPGRLGIHGARELRAASEGSFIGLEAGPLGLGASWTRSANGGLDFGQVQPLSFTVDAGFTVAVVAAPVNVAQIKTAVSFRKTSSQFEQIGAFFNSTASVSASAGLITLFSRNTSGTTTAVTATGGIDGGLHCWVLGNSAASGYIYRDGAELTLSTSTRPSGTISSTAQKTHIGNLAAYASDGAFVIDDPLLLVIVWPRLLPAAEAAEWSRRLALTIGEAFEPDLIPIHIATAGASFNPAWAVRNARTIGAGVI